MPQQMTGPGMQPRVAKHLGSLGRAPVNALTRARQHPNRHPQHDLLPVFPPMQLRQIIRAHQPHKPRADKPCLQSGNGLGRIACAQIGFDISEGRIRFTVEEEPVEAIDLPDGFRSSVAWLADLCDIWCEKFPDVAANGKPEEIEAIVLIDEIDLHLHPSLQRTLVPRLREALPRVQWIATTHSPLVLSSFDSSEIVALDRKEPDGLRRLDRQILGFTTDQIYNWLMETPATSAAMETRLREADGSDASDEEMARLLEMSPDVDESQARDRVRKLASRLDKLKS